MFTTTMTCMNMHYDATVSSKLFNRDAAIKIYVHVLSIYYTFSTLVIPKNAAGYSSCLVSSDGISSSFTMDAVSPTCFLVLTSRFRNRDRIAASFIVNPWVLPLMTASCYCSGSELDDSLLRCK